MAIRTHHDAAAHGAAVESVTNYLQTAGVDEERAREAARDALRDAHESAVVERLESSRSWWSLALRGALAIAAGMVFVSRPLTAVQAVVLVLGAWIFVDGIIAFVSTITQRHRSWTQAPIGVVGAIIGYLILTRTGSATVFFFMLTAAWALARGATEIAVAARMSKHEPGRGSLVVLGLSSFAFGLLLLLAPLAGVVALGWWIGIYALVYGLISVIRAFQVGHVSREVRAMWTGPSHATAAPQPA